MAKPEKIAPATKWVENGCVPTGITEVAKSNDTIVCTDRTSGVANPNTKKPLQNVASLLHVHSTELNRP